MLDALGVRVVRQSQIKAGEMYVAHRLDLPTYLEQRHLRRFLKDFRIDCVFDVGANSGQYARMIRDLGYDGHIISFEPIPALAEALRKEAASDPRWHIEQLALDEDARDTVFNVMADSQFSSLNRPSAEQTQIFSHVNVVAEEVPVRTERLDTILARYRERFPIERPFLKMDTQGNDLPVASGAGDHLKDFAGLQSELCFTKIYENQVGYREAIDFYEARGFVLSALVPNNGGHFPAMVEMDCIMFNPAFAPPRGA